MHFNKKQNNVRAFANLHIRPIIRFTERTVARKVSIRGLCGSVGWICVCADGLTF